MVKPEEGLSIPVFFSLKMFTLLTGSFDSNNNNNNNFGMTRPGHELNCRLQDVLNFRRDKMLSRFHVAETHLIRLT